MERREKKKRGREGEATTTMKSSDSNAKKRELLLSGNSCLCDSSLEEGEQTNEHHPQKACEYEDGNESEVGVFDFPWLKEGTTSKGYYDDECRLEFEDLVAGCYGSSSAASTCLDFSDHDFSLDHHFFQQNWPSDDHRSDDDRGGELPILREKNVEELDGIWSSVLDQPLDNSIVTFHKL